MLSRLRRLVRDRELAGSTFTGDGTFTGDDSLAGDGSFAGGGDGVGVLGEDAPAETWCGRFEALQADGTLFVGDVEG